MKKIDKRETINLFFSAFLIIAFIICAHFFTQFTATLEPVVGTIVSVLLYVVFGLLMFYATRVGDGKSVKRFSIATLVVLVIPSLYIIIAAIAPGLPLHDVFVAENGGLNVIVTLACVALGYGIPYTFISGYELEADSEEVEVAESTVLEGGIEADLEDTTEEATAETEDAVEETTEETIETANNEN